jgi:hypothetical protein
MRAIILLRRIGCAPNWLRTRLHTLKMMTGIKTSGAVK